MPIIQQRKLGRIKYHNKDIYMISCMISFVAICAVAFISEGCVSRPVPEYNYRGTLWSVEVNPALALDFAKSLATEANLKIVDQDERTGNERLDAAFAVYLKHQEDGHILVTIMVHIPTRTLFVRINGDIKSPIAIAIGQKAEVLYARKYPGSTLTRYTRHQGLLGP